MSDFVTQYLEESRQVIERLDASAIEREIKSSST